MFTLVLGSIFAVALPAQAYTKLCGNYGDTPSFTCVSFSGFNGQQPWGYPVDANGHNCTNYATYRLWQNGVSKPANLGYAKDWDNNAPQGVPVNGTPSVGAIAQWEAYSGPALESGHVAYVDAVTSSYIDVSEDNYDGTTMTKRFFVGQSGWPDHFIHFKDVTPAAPSGTLLQVENSGSSWAAYNLSQASGGIQTQGTPAVMWLPGGPMIFVADSNGALRQFTICPGGSGWCSYVVPIGSTLGGAGVGVTMNGSSIEVFAVTTDGTLLQVEHTSSGWASYDISQAAGSVKVKGSPTVMWSGATPSVFAIASDGSLRQFTICSNAGWCALPITQTNIFGGGVGGTMNGSSIELFSRSVGGHLYQVEFNGSSWATYDVTNFAGNVQVDGTPGVIWTASGPSVFASDTNGGLRQFALCSGGSSWCTYQVLPAGAMGSGGGVTATLNGSVIEVILSSH